MFMFLVFIPRTWIIFLDKWVKLYYKPRKNSHNQNKNFNPKLPYQKPVPPTLLKHSPSFLSLPKLKASSLSLPKHGDLSLPNHVHGRKLRALPPCTSPLPPPQMVVVLYFLSLTSPFSLSLDFAQIQTQTKPKCLKLLTQIGALLSLSTVDQFSFSPLSWQSAFDLSLTSLSVFYLSLFFLYRFDLD